MTYTATLRGERFPFADLRELLAKANEPKSGDALAGIAATSMRERLAAKLALADVSLREIADAELIDDDVSAQLTADHDRAAFASIAALTVGELRDLLLDPQAVASCAALPGRGITPEWSDGAAAASEGTGLHARLDLHGRLLVLRSGSYRNLWDRPSRAS